VTPHQEHLAIAGFAMAWGILGCLHSKGIITTEETIDLLDGAILWLEEVRGQDAVVQGSRAVLGELIEHIRTMRPDPN
jgi:hypothetical protein